MLKSEPSGLRLKVALLLHSVTEMMTATESCRLCDYREPSLACVRSSSSRLQCWRSASTQTCSGMVSAHDSDLHLGILHCQVQWHQQSAVPNSKALSSACITGTLSRCPGK